MQEADPQVDADAEAGWHACCSVKVMEKPDDKRTPPPEPDPGRSRERRQQDAMLERAARQESWLSRLWRSRRERKAKPDPGSQA